MKKRISFGAMFSGEYATKEEVKLGSDLVEFCSILMTVVLMLVLIFYAVSPYSRPVLNLITGV